MGFFDKIKEVMNAPGDDDYEYEDDYEETNEDSDFMNYSSRSESSRSESRGTSKDNKVVNIHATTQLQVVLVKPEEFSEAPTIGDHLNNKRTVVLNLESTPKDVARRLVDFLSGVAYANNGTLKRVANSTFIITPYNVDIMGDMLIDELESNGLY